jgi:hypothetical protein
MRFTSADELNRQWQELLVGRNKFLVPEYQLATRIVTASNSGANRIYYNPSHTDIRVGEKILLLGQSFTVTIAQTDGCSIAPLLPASLPVGSVVAPLVEAIAEEGATISRYAVHDAADVSIRLLLSRLRTTLVRPGHTSPLTLWAGVPVLDVLPMAKSNPSDTLVDSQISIDNKIALTRLEDRWSESKILSTREYLVSRLPILSCPDGMRRDLDYWRHFLQYCRGSQKKFWLPTYRQDLTLMEVPSGNSATVLVKGYDFATKIYPNQLTHRYFEFVADEATHRAEVYNIISEGANARCYVTPAFPPDWDFYNIKRVSHLIPSRIDNDDATWEHQGQHSILKLSFKTAEG